MDEQLHISKLNGVWQYTVMDRTFSPFRSFEDALYDAQMMIKLKARMHHRQLVVHSMHLKYSLTNEDDNGIIDSDSQLTEIT